MAETPTAPTSDQIAEWLTSHGVTFGQKRVAIAGIDKKQSLGNQSRFTPLVDEVVETYAAAMRGGDKFPPIVVRLVGGSYVVIDGNHRMAAAERAGFSELLAYLVEDVSDGVAQVMTFEANAKHGLPSSIEERIEHGIYLVDTHLVSQKDAARMVNVPLGSFQTQYAHHEADRRMARIGIERWQELKKTTRVRLANIHSDVILRAATKVVVEAKLSVEATQNFVTGINRERTEADQLAFVDKMRESYSHVTAMTGGGRLPSAQSLRLARALGSIEGVVLDEVPVTVQQLTPEQRTAMAERIRRSILILLDVQRGLENAA